MNVVADDLLAAASLFLRIQRGSRSNVGDSSVKIFNGLTNHGRD